MNSDGDVELPVTLYSPSGTNASMLARGNPLTLILPAGDLIALVPLLLIPAAVVSTLPTLAEMAFAVPKLHWIVRTEGERNAKIA